MAPIWRDELASLGHVQVSIEDGPGHDLPQSVLAGLEAAIFKAGRDTEVIAALGATGAQVSLPDSAEFARTLQRDVAHWVKVVTENPGSR
jgi:tripartite-type tricarboxylate transporter receptor subunit TctC